MKLKTTEVYIPTPFTINTKLYYTDTTQDFPIDKSGTYTCTFFAYNGSYNSGSYNTEHLVRVSIINQNGTETVLYYPDRLPDEVYEDYFSNTIYVSGGSKYRVTCLTGTNGAHGVVECLTIKGIL
jgi:hypothetical protein